MRHLLRPLPLALAGMLAVGAVGLGVAVDRLSPERTDAIELVAVDDEFAREEDLPAELRVEPPSDDDEDLERRRADRWAATAVDVDDTSDDAPVTALEEGDDTDDTVVAAASSDQSDDAPTSTASVDDSDDAPATSSTTTTPVAEDASVDDDDESVDAADDESVDDTDD